MRLLVAFKRILSRFVTVTEFCKSCGRETDLVWHAPDDLWREVTGEQHGGGVRCTKCFDAACYAHGKILRWLPEVAHVRGPDGEWRSPFMTGTEMIEEFRRRAPNALENLDFLNDEGDW
jgi:hypothetical protein